MPYYTRSDALSPTAETPPMNSTTSSTPKRVPQSGKRNDAPDTAEHPDRKKARTAPTTEDDRHDLIELPHNMGQIRRRRIFTSAQVVKTEEQSSSSLTNGVHPTAIKEENTTLVATETTISKTKKTKRIPRNPYGLTPGISPYPDWPRPTFEECGEVNGLLSELHGEIKAPAAIPTPSLTISGCGEVPSILDALLRTVLSGATTKGNSGKAFEGLVAKFGVIDRGIGKGSVDWEEVRLAPLEDVEQAIKSGGLAAIKSKNIKSILDMVYEENLERRAKNEVAELADDLLSLNHLHCLSKDEAMLQLVKYPGIGVKTAACVILFCLQRPCFAVDTHVFRLSKWLKWLPTEKKVDEITAFRHLEVRVPEHLKYSLHQLFLEHGKTCQRCRASTGDSTDTCCPIDHLVERTGKRKGKGKAMFRQSKLSLELKPEDVKTESESLDI